MSSEDPTPGAAEVNFTAFVLSLSSAALQHLGQGQSEGEQAPVSLPMAQQTIDILAMLQKKTSGNLTAEEDKLLGIVLHDLRMQFVEAARRSGG